MAFATGAFKSRTASAGSGEKAHEDASSPSAVRSLAAEVNIQHQQIVNNLDIDAEKVLRELARCGFNDPRKFFNEDGSLKKVTELDDDAAAALSSVEVDEISAGEGEARKVIGYTRKIKFWSKPDTLKLLAMYHKLLGAERAPTVMVQVELSDARTRLLAKLAS